jgi:hypothetical protein
MPNVRLMQRKRRVEKRRVPLPKRKRRGLVEECQHVLRAARWMKTSLLWLAKHLQMKHVPSY